MTNIFLLVRRLSLLTLTVGLVGCGSFYAIDKDNARESVRRCEPLSFGGTRADLASLFTTLNPIQHPYSPCVAGEPCGWPNIVGAKVVVLADLPLSVFVDTMAFPGLLLADTYVQYLRFHHWLQGQPGAPCLPSTPDAPFAPAPPRLDTHFGPAVATTEACAAVRGRWEILAATGRPYCVVPTGDGGTACQDTADCQGFCVVPPGPRASVAPGTRVSGVCASSYEQDCFQFVFQGVAQPRTCLGGATPGPASRP